jgi:hypothetical protein
MFTYIYIHAYIHRYIISMYINIYTYTYIYIHMCINIYIPYTVYVFPLIVAIFSRNTDTNQPYPYIHKYAYISISIHISIYKQTLIFYYIIENNHENFLTYRLYIHINVHKSYSQICEHIYIM